jgi:hypothetical protein
MVNDGKQGSWAIMSKIGTVFLKAGSALIYQFTSCRIVIIG